MSEIIFKSTASAKSHADTIKRAAYGFTEFSEKMYDAKEKITKCWEGDSQDINDITGDLLVVSDDAKEISTCLQNLALGVNCFAQAVEEIGKGNNAGSGDSSNAGSGDSSNNVNASENNGFWANQKKEFANDWDYSECDGVLDYIGATIGGVIGTVGSSVNFITDAVGELFKWIF